MFQTKLLKKGLVATVAAGGLLFAIAGPASATQVDAGAGVGNGWEEPRSDPDPCPTPPPLNNIPPVDAIYPNLIGEIDGSDFDIQHTGTVVGFDSSGTQVAVFAGNTRFQIGVGTHVISPVGTSPVCPDPLALELHPFPTPIESASVEDVDGPTTPPLPAGNVNCDALLANPAPLPASTYMRVHDVASFTMTLRCDITGNVAPFTGTVLDVPTTFAVQGLMDACTLVPPLGDDSPEHPMCTIFNLFEGTGEVIAPGNPDAGTHLTTTYAAVGLVP